MALIQEICFSLVPELSHTVAGGWYQYWMNYKRKEGVLFHQYINFSISTSTISKFLPCLVSLSASTSLKADQYLAMSTR